MLRFFYSKTASLWITFSVIMRHFPNWAPYILSDGILFFLNVDSLIKQCDVLIFLHYLCLFFKCWTKHGDQATHAGPTSGLEAQGQSRDEGLEVARQSGPSYTLIEVSISLLRLFNPPYSLKKHMFCAIMIPDNAYEKGCLAILCPHNSNFLSFVFRTLFPDPKKY